jgi:hypothetical protein
MAHANTHLRCGLSQQALRVHMAGGWLSSSQIAGQNHVGSLLGGKVEFPSNIPICPRAGLPSHAVDFMQVKD